MVTEEGSNSPGLCADVELEQCILERGQDRHTVVWRTAKNGDSFQFLQTDEFVHMCTCLCVPRIRSRGLKALRISHERFNVLCIHLF